MSKKIITFTFLSVICCTSLNAITLENKTGVNLDGVSIFAGVNEHQKEHIFINEDTNSIPNQGKVTVDLHKAFEKMHYYIHGGDLTINVNIVAYAGKHPRKSPAYCAHVLQITKDTDATQENQLTIEILPGEDHCVVR